MTTRTWKPSRRLVATRTGAATLLLSGASLLGLAVLSAGAATAAGSVTSVDPSTNTPLSTTKQQPAATVFSANLPSGAACPGDTASNAYHVYSFLVPTGTDPASVSFASNGPSLGNGGYFDNSGYQGPFNTAVKTGQVVGLPNDLQWSTYPGPVSDLTGTKSWDAGWACADGKGVVQRYWDQQVTFTASTSDPNKFTWTATAAPTAPTTSSSSSSTSSTSSTSTSTSTSTTSTTADTTTTLDPSSTTTTVDPNSPTTLADASSGSTSTTVCVPSSTSTTQAARTTTTAAGATTTTAPGVTTTTAAPASTTSKAASAPANATCASANSSTSSTLGGAAAVKGDSAAASPASPASASGSSAAQSTLPFTGLPGDKAVGLGIFLIGAGLALVVAAHRRQELERLMWPDQV